MRVRILAAFLCASLAVFGWAEASHAQGFVPEENEFAAALVMQPKTHKILWAFKPDKPHAAASLTKLATALAFLESKPSWNSIVRLSSVDEVGGGRLRVDSGATLSIRDLFYSALTSSANNAAMALGRLGAKDMKAFVASMNAAAARAGAKHSVFYEPSGMDPKNTITAQDAALLAEAAFKNAVAHSASTVGQYAFTVRNTGERKVIQNTNKPLLEDDDVWLVGGKTGFLYESEYNLVAQLRPSSSDEKHEVIVVVLGSPTYNDSFRSVKRMAEWAWQHPELFATPIDGKTFSQSLVYGMSNEHVRTVQEWLAMDKEVYPEGKVTGFFGPMTLEAVRRFQLKYKVVSSSSDRGYGIVGPATREKLYEFVLEGGVKEEEQPAAKQASAPIESKTAPTFAIQETLVYGETNGQVRELQKILSGDKSVYPEGIVSGFFGPLTLEAVQRFQLKYKVVSSPKDRGFGVVGPATRAKLLEIVTGKNV